MRVRRSLTPPEFTEEANPNDCQQEVLSRKIGASRKHHNINQLQQIITAVRHQGKTKTVNFSMFFLARRRQGFGATRAIWFNASCLENFKDGLWFFFRRFKLKAWD
jgi:hypothetical protein